jgi:putative DNA primase/helicase
MADEEEGEGALLEKLLADAADMASVRPAAREEALRGLFARMARAGLSATAESTLLAAVKAATKIPMASLREDYKRIKGDSARAEKARRREEAAEGGEADAGEDEQPTQRSVAAAFVSSHDGLVVFNHSSGCWLAFNERAGVWRPDEVEAVLDRISAVAKAALEASEFSDAPATRASVESASFVAGAAKLARADGRMRKLAKEFDRAPHLLGTPGGIYDLRTGQRIEGDGREALVTKTTAVAPADKGRCPRFIAFLDEACGGDPDLVEHVVRALGYVLWGGNPEEVIVFLFGPGGNGKSVLVALMRWLLHEYAQTASMATFQEAQGDRASHDVAMLAGARLVAATETKKGRTWDEQRVNALTGGDMITARHLYGQFFSFMPQFLPLLAGNHKPALATVNEAALPALAVHRATSGQGYQARGKAAGRRAGDPAPADQRVRTVACGLEAGGDESPAGARGRHRSDGRISGRAGTRGAVGAGPMRGQCEGVGQAQHTACRLHRVDDRPR